MTTFRLFLRYDPGWGNIKMWHTASMVNAWFNRRWRCR